MTICFRLLSAYLKYNVLTLLTEWQAVLLHLEVPVYRHFTKIISIIASIFYCVEAPYFIRQILFLTSRIHFWYVAWCRLVVGYRHFEAIHLYYLVVKVFNMLPSNIKIESDNPKKFKLVWQKLVYENSFYSLDEYFEIQKSLFIYDLN